MPEGYTGENSTLPEALVVTLTLTLHPRAPETDARQRVSVIADGELPEYGQVCRLTP